MAKDQTDKEAAEEAQQKKTPLVIVFGCVGLPLFRQFIHAIYKITRYVDWDGEGCIRVGQYPAAKLRVQLQDFHAGALLFDERDQTALYIRSHRLANYCDIEGVLLARME
jgi:hypothetical protein